MSTEINYFDGQFRHFLNAYSEKIYRANAKKGFWDTNREKLDNAIRSLGLPNLDNHSINMITAALQTQRSIPESLALIHSEVSEALEGDRKNKMDDHLTHRKSLEVELADTIIRCLDLSGELGLDIGGAVMEKLDYNTKRPPMHGDGKRY